MKKSELSRTKYPVLTGSRWYSSLERALLPTRIPAVVWRDLGHFVGTVCGMRAHHCYVTPVLAAMHLAAGRFSPFRGT